MDTVRSRQETKMIAPYLTFFILGMIVGGLAGAFVILLFQAHIELVED